MAVRTTPTLVKGIVRIKGEAQLMPYIESANMLVTARCAPLAYSEKELEIIERWLSAHLYKVSNPQLSREVIGRATEEVLLKVDLGLDATVQGQQVKMLDYLGGLSGVLGPRKTVKATWLGSDPETRYRRYGRRGYGWGWRY